MFVAMAPVRFRSRDDVPGLFGRSVTRRDFFQDRQQFMLGALDVSRLPDLWPSAYDQTCIFLQVLERALRQSDFLAGREPSLADFSAHHLVWWLEHAPRVSVILDAFPEVVRWLKRVSCLGHEDMKPMDAFEALAEARGSEPVDVLGGPFEDATERRIGQDVRLCADDYGRDVVHGKLVAATEDEVVLLRETEETGTLFLHFPRIAFEILPQSSWEEDS